MHGPPQALRRRCQRLAIGLIPFAGMFAGDEALSAGWASFQNGGVAGMAASLPTEWGAERFAWKVELTGYGQSSPVSHRSQVYVTSVSGENKETLHVVALDLASGAELWRHDSENSTPAKNNNYVSRAAPTPVCDEAGVIAFFEGGNVIALTPAGDERWRRDLVADYGAISARHGLAASLEQDEESLFVWVERQEEPYVLALDKKTGETLWKQPGVGATSWSSPRLVAVGDAQHLVLSAVGTVAGYDPQSGERLWTLDGIVGNSAPTPFPLGEGRFLLGATTGRGEAGSGAAAASNGVVAIERAAEGGFSAEYVWRAKRATTSFGSPIAHEGYAYFVNRSGVVYCLDLDTGDEQYAKRTGSSIWATPIAVGSRIYLFGKDGSTTVLRSGPQFEVLGEAKLDGDDPANGDGDGAGARTFGGPVLYAAAVADGHLLMRRGDRIYCVAPAAESSSGG